MVERWLVVLPLAACGAIAACGYTSKSTAQQAATAPPQAEGVDTLNDAAALTAGPPTSVIEHHNAPSRNGVYTVPGLTRSTALGMRAVASFDGTLSGSVATQPLYVTDGPGARGTFYVTTELNTVFALDEASGAVVWSKSFGTPTDSAGGGCAIRGITPVGIAGTPYIDHARRALYFDTTSASGPAGSRVLVTHLIHAVSIDDGTELQGWPVDASIVAKEGGFAPSLAHQHGALALVNGTLFIPYGSFGDCGDYHGAVIAIDVDHPDRVSAWVSRGRATGVWAPHGVSSDGANVFFATGNGAAADDDPTGQAWAGSEAGYRFAAGAIRATPDDYYAAPNWKNLDTIDADLGGSGVLIIEQPRSTPSSLAVLLGKDGSMVMVDAHNMGGIGAQTLFSGQVATHDITVAPAAVPNDRGTMLIFDAMAGGAGVGCPDGQSGHLVGVQITAGSPPTVQVAWCNTPSGYGSPMVTTTDGQHEAIVWLTGASKSYGGSGSLVAFDANTGDFLYSSDSLDGLARFNTPIAANDHLAVAANDRLYLFAYR